MIVTFLLLVILHLLTPYWWWVLLVPALVGFWRNGTAWGAIRSGALGAGLVWFGAGLHLQLTHAVLILPKIEAMIGAQSHFLMLLATGLVAVICGAAGAWSGHSLRRAIWAPAQTGTPRSPEPPPNNSAEAEKDKPDQ